MTIIQQLQQSIAAGLTLAEALTVADIEADESNLRFWKRILDNQADPTKLKRKPKRRTTSRRQSRSTDRPSKRTNYAEQVLARGYATAEMVERVNATPAAA